jgi:CBS domain-containing protein
VIGDIIIGMVGALIGWILFERTGIFAGSSLIGSLLVATSGAIIFLYGLRVRSKRHRWRCAMKSYRVKDLMVPLSEYATVPEAATLLEAVKTLRKAQDEFGRNRYQHRAILVFDGNNHFVGKLSQHDVIEALEPKYKRMGSS